MEVKFLSKSAQKRARRNGEIAKMFTDLKEKGIKNSVIFREIADELELSTPTVITVLKQVNLI